MALSKVQREQMKLDMRKAYDSYQEKRRSMRDRIRLEIEKRVEEEEGIALEDLSKLLHDMHDKGLSWMDLRWATRSGGNSGHFNRLRSAFSPEGSTDLQAKANKERDQEAKGWRWVDESTLEVTVGGEKVVVSDIRVMSEDKTYGGEEFVESWPEFEAPEEALTEHYPEIHQAVTEALAERAGE